MAWSGRLCSLLVVLAIAVPGVSGDYTVAVVPNTTYGVWEGWGTSLAWWADVFGDRDDVADVVFTLKNVTIGGEVLPGLGLNIARYNVGGCSFVPAGGDTMQVSKNMIKTRQVFGYWMNWTSDDPASSSWDWSADALQREMLLKAKARGANLFELFSNSPMWWMCDNHNPSGSNDGVSDNLQSWNHGQHAVYLSTVAAYAAQHWPLRFTSVEAFNEPSSAWWRADGTQEGCHFNAGTQATVVPLLRAEMDKRGLTDIIVSASDKNTYDLARSTWESFGDDVKGRIGRVNTHGYQYGSGRRDLLYEAVHGKKLWNSEYGEGDATGLSLATNLALDFSWLHNTAWVYWQVLDGGGWGLISVNEDARTVGPANNKYHVLAQYARHIRPGAVIVSTSDANSVAAFDRARGVLVLVSLNGYSAQRISYDLGRVGGLRGPAQRWLTTTDGKTKYARQADLPLTGTTLTTTVPANAVQTLEIAASMTIEDVDSGITSTRYEHADFELGMRGDQRWEKEDMAHGPHPRNE